MGAKNKTTLAVEVSSTSPLSLQVESEGGYYSDAEQTVCVDRAEQASISTRQGVSYGILRVTANGELKVSFSPDGRTWERTTLSYDEWTGLALGKQVQGRRERAWQIGEAMPNG